MQGGLQLPGRVRRWSSLVPPEIRIASAEARSLEVEIAQVRLLTDKVPPVKQRFDRPVAILPIGPLQLPDGDYEIRVGVKQSLRASTRSTDLLRLSLRSGDNPSPVSAESGPLVRVLDDGGAAVLTSRRSADSGRTLRGPVLAGGSESDDFAFQSHSVGEPTWWSQRSRTEVRQPSRSPSPIAVPAAELADDCFHTGAHHIVLPPFLGRATRSTIEGVCRGCGLVKRYPARYRPGHRRSSDLHPVGPRIDVTLVEPVPETRSISPDAALDALGYARMGTASSFEQVSLQVDPSQLFVDRFLRALEALGHIEVARDPWTLAPLEWEIVPPALVELVSGSFCAAGHRGLRLERALEATVTHAGGHLERTPMAAAPTLLRVMGVSRESAIGIAAELSESTGFTIQVIPEASLRLASVLPAFSGLIGQLSRQPMIGYRSAKRWDADVARWYPVEDASVPGAYQLTSGATVYCLREPTDIDEGTMRRADARVVKHAEALRLGRPLLGYHSTTKMLYVPRAADLPLLYERAAVLASGSMPSPIERQRLLCYREIPVDLAKHLAALLSS